MAGKLGQHIRARRAGFRSALFVSRRRRNAAPSDGEGRQQAGSPRSRKPGMDDRLILKGPGAFRRLAGLRPGGASGGRLCPEAAI